MEKKRNNEINMNFFIEIFVYCYSTERVRSFSEKTNNHFYSLPRKKKICVKPIEIVCTFKCTITTSVSLFKCNWHNFIDSKSLCYLLGSHVHLAQHHPWNALITFDFLIDDVAPHRRCPMVMNNGNSTYLWYYTQRKHKRIILCYLQLPLLNIN